MVEGPTDGESVGFEVPGYHLRGCLARTAVSSVHRAEAVGHPGRLLVVKHLRTRPDATSLARVREVAAVLARLDHPNVLPLLDVVDTGSGIALVTPLAPGGSLAEAIERAPTGLPPAMVAEIGTRIADGLAAIHDQGLVHGAITARSVLFDARGRPLLADTGVALVQGGDRNGHAPPSTDRPHRSSARDAAGDLRALGSVLAAALPGTEVDSGDLPSDDRAGGTTDDDLDPGSVDVAAAPTGTSSQEPLDAVAPGPGVPAALTAVTEGAAAAEADHEVAFPADQIAPGGHEPGRWTRVALVVAAGLILLVPLVLVLTAIDDPATVVASSAPTTTRPDPDPSEREAPAPAPPGATTTVPRPPPAVPRRPPAACDGLDVPPGDGAVLLADLDGRGCSTPVRWNGRELAVATARTTPRRWELLADDGDQLLFGDLNCDDRDAPVLYRPATGEVFVFDGLVAPGEEVTVTGQPSGRIGGRATIVTDSTGCDRIEVDHQRRSDAQR